MDSPSCPNASIGHPVRLAMKIDTGLGVTDSGDVIARAKRAEELGFDGLWSADTEYDAFLPLVLAAEHTTRIELGTAIALAFPRSPMTLAYIGWDLQKMSAGRLYHGSRHPDQATH